VNRKLTLFLFLITAFPFAMAQSAQHGQDPTPNPDTIGTKLIVWSEFQQPKPIVDPAAHPDVGSAPSPMPTTTDSPYINGSQRLQSQPGADFAVQNPTQVLSVPNQR
jgi:hypothetical protein